MINSNLYKNTFKTSFEVVPPKYEINSIFLKKLVRHSNKFDLLDLTCCPMANLRITPISLAHSLISQGISPKKIIINFSTRDRNTLALQSEILGALAMKIDKILVVKGDRIIKGNSKKSKEVFEINTGKLIKILSELRQGYDYSKNRTNTKLNYEIFSTLNLNKSYKELIKIINQRLKQGSNFFITQPIFSEKDFELMSKLSLKTDYKILCGVLPITNIKVLHNVLKKLGGIDVESEHLKKMQKIDENDIFIYSKEYLKNLIKVYKEHLDGIHIMTSGDISKALKLIENL